MSDGISWGQSAWAFQAFVKQFATTIEEGQALWSLIQNKDIFQNEKQIQSGSLRWIAHIIASVVGDDYLMYYCVTEAKKGQMGFRKETKARIAEKLKAGGVELRDIKID